MRLFYALSLAAVMLGSYASPWTPRAKRGTERNQREPFGTMRNETEPNGTVGNRSEPLGTVGNGPEIRKSIDCKGL